MPTVFHIRKAKWKRHSDPAGFSTDIPPKRLKTRPQPPSRKKTLISLYISIPLPAIYPSLCMYIQVHEFEIPRAEAEKVLAENGGDIAKALHALIL